jgi:hypothetical protein
MGDLYICFSFAQASVVVVATCGRPSIELSAISWHRGAFVPGGKAFTARASGQMPPDPVADRSTNLLTASMQLQGRELSIEA